MTRINVVPVEVLTNKHAMAEYHELPRVFTFVKKQIKKGNSPKDIEIPRRYTLGKGHAKFFYNKVHFLEMRIRQLHTNLTLRGYEVSWPKLAYILESNTKHIGIKWRNQYEPTHRDIYLNMARLAKRVSFPNVKKELKSNEK